MPLQRCSADTSIGVVSQLAVSPGDPDATIMIGYKKTGLWTIAGHLPNFLRDLIGDSKEMTSESQSPNILITIISDGIVKSAACTLAVRALDLMESAMVVTHQPAAYSEPNHTTMVLKQRSHILTGQPTCSRKQ